MVPFCLLSLLDVRGGRDHREPAETQGRRLPECLFRSSSNRGRLSIAAAIAGQYVFARLADDVRGRLLKPLQQRMIRFHHVKFGVVQQHQILDGVERVAPLPMGTQNLLHQAQIFHRQPS